jgi:hypothetical protein
LGQVTTATERDRAVSAPATGGRSAIVPFLVGTAVGGLTGVVVGALLGDQVAHVVAGMAGIVDRRGSSGDEGEPRFDLLLQ